MENSLRVIFSHYNIITRIHVMRSLEPQLVPIFDPKGVERTVVAERPVGVSCYVRTCDIILAALAKT